MTTTDISSLPAIKEWHQLTSNREREAVLTGKSPAVIRGCVADWPLVLAAKTSVMSLTDYLLQFDQGKVFQAMVAPPSEQGRLFYGPDLRTFNFKRMNGYLRDGLDILTAQVDLEQAPAFYIGSTLVSEYLPGLELENTLDFLDQTVEPNIWIGNPVTVATHNDNFENIACIAAGRRRFTLFPPEQVDNLYIGTQDATPGGRPISLVDLKAPDYNKYPLFEEALKHGQTAVLEPGDAIYIPTDWWHHVDSLDKLNILVNFWWRGAPPRL